MLLSGFFAGFFCRAARLAVRADFLDARDVAVGVKAGDFHEVALFVVITFFAAGFAVAVGHVAYQRAVWVEVLHRAVYFVVLEIHDAFNAAVRVEKAAFTFPLAVLVGGDDFRAAVGVAFDHEVVKFAGGIVLYELPMRPGRVSAQSSPPSARAVQWWVSGGGGGLYTGAGST